MSSEAALEARSVSFLASGRSIIRDFTLSASVGEIIAITGPSGSGKTTLLMMLGGFIQPTTGSVIVAAAPNESRRQGTVGFVSQRFALIPYLTAMENVATVLRSDSRSAETRSSAITALKAVGLSDVIDRLGQDLSGGQQQRVAVARAVAGEPGVILADEPTSQLDTDNRKRIVDLLRDRARRGASVILSSDDPDVISACDRVVELAVSPTFA